MNEELIQKIWELEFGLLNADEAAALRARIDSEPEVTRARDRVREDMKVVAEAARIRVAPISLDPTVSVNAASAKAVSANAAQVNAAQAKAESGPAKVDSGPALRGNQPVSRADSFRRLASWAVGIAASLLLFLTGYALIESGRPVPSGVASNSESEIAARVMARANRPELDRQKVERQKITVDAPAEIHPQVPTRLYVQTSTPAGEPRSGNVVVNVKGADGVLRYSESIATDGQGHGSIVLPTPKMDDFSQLEVADAAGKELGAVVVDLDKKQSDDYLTYVATDRPWYRRGETVRFRSVTLSRFAWRADRDTNVDFQVTNPAGEELPQYKSSAVTTKGVSAGEFVLNEQLPEGKYTIAASHMDGLFPPSHRDFYVKEETTRQWNVAVHWGATEFKQGENVTAKVAVHAVDGKPAADVPLQLEAYVDGHSIPLNNTELKTDALGERALTFQLPATIESGEGFLQVTPGTDTTLDERIPIRVDRAIVDVFPEGGDLVTGVESRVYFFSHDPLGRPLMIGGDVIDSNGNSVATLETVHEGRGSFLIAPQANTTYSVRVSSPAGVDSQSVLPPPSDRSTIVMDCGMGVFGADDSLSVRLKSNSPPSEMTIAANCRGALVGYKSVSAADFANGMCEVPIEIADEAGGVLRVTVYAGQGSEPLAERLVYRVPRHQLSIQCQGLADDYPVGARVKLKLSSTDEAGSPIPAVLGLAIVDDEVLKPVHPPTPRLETEFALLGDIESAEKLEDANFYVAGTDESRTALDLLLATQGWRRIRSVSGERLARDGVSDPLAAFSLQESRAKQWAANGDAPGTAEVLGMNAYSKDYGSFYYRRKLADTDETVIHRYDNSASLKDATWETESLFSAAKSDMPTMQSPAGQFAPTLPSTKPSSRELWWVTFAIAGVVFVVSLIALVGRLTSSRRVAWVGMAVALGAAILGTVIITGKPDAPPAIAVAERSDGPNVSALVKEQKPHNEELRESDKFFGADSAPRSQGMPGGFGLESKLTESPAAGLRGGGMGGGGMGGVAASGSVPRPAEAGAPVDPARVQLPPGGGPGGAGAGKPNPPPSRDESPQPSTEGAPQPPPKPSPKSSPAAPAFSPAPPNPVPSTPAGLPLPKEDSPTSKAETAALKSGKMEPAAPKGKDAGIKAGASTPIVPEAQAPESDSKLLLMPKAGLPAPTRRMTVTKTETPAPTDQPVPPKVPQEVTKEQSDRSRYAFPSPKLNADDKSQSRRRMSGAESAENKERARGFDSRSIRLEDRKKDSLGAKPSSDVWFKKKSGSLPDAAKPTNEPAEPEQKLSKLMIVREYAHLRPLSDKANKQLVDNTEVLYWNPLLLTDADGNAEVEFDLSDAVTKYQIQVDGHENGRLGSATKEIVVKPSP